MGGDVFRAAVVWLCFKLPSCLFVNNRDTFDMHEKAIFVCFVYMQPQKVKFKYVQINMKQVSYFDNCLSYKIAILHIKLTFVKLILNIYAHIL